MKSASDVSVVALQAVDISTEPERVSLAEYNAFYWVSAYNSLLGTEGLKPFLAFFPSAAKQAQQPVIPHQNSNAWNLALIYTGMILGVAGLPLLVYWTAFSTTTLGFVIAGGSGALRGLALAGIIHRHLCSKKLASSSYSIAAGQFDQSSFKPGLDTTKGQELASIPAPIRQQAATEQSQASPGGRQQTCLRLR